MSGKELYGRRVKSYTGVGKEKYGSHEGERIRDDQGRKTDRTYSTLAEQREVLTPAEQNFEKERQTIGLFLGPVVFLVMYFLPLPLEPNQQTLAATLSYHDSLRALGSHPHPGHGDPRPGAHHGAR